MCLRRVFSTLVSRRTVLLSPTIARNAKAFSFCQPIYMVRTMPFCCPPKDKPDRAIAIDDTPIVEAVIGKAIELPAGTKKEYEVQGRKILVVNDNGTYYATSGLCSHYNAPLAMGVYHDGKIRCPYHGACFNIKTGDIEDYPGFDSLHTYEVRKRGEELVIKATEKTLGSDRRIRKPPRVHPTNAKPVVIVGGGVAAATFMEHFRLQGGQQPLMIVTEETNAPYDRVLCSKNLGGDMVPLRDSAYYKENHIDVRTGTRVTKVDPSAHSISLSDGNQLQYSKLVLATGGAVRKLEVPGGNLKNVYTLRQIEDAQAIAKHISPDLEAVCIGGSFIGMEAASSLQLGNVKKITIVVNTDEPLPAFGKDIGAAVRRLFESKGIAFKLASKVVSLQGDDKGAVKSVQLEGGEVIPASLVIAGIGVTPATDFLKPSGIEMDKRGFVAVDTAFHTSTPDVYAIGDIVSAPLPLWNIPSINIQHFQVAQRHGQLAAYSMLGKKAPGDVVPFFWSLYFFSNGVRFAGCAEGFDETYLRGNPDEFNFVKYYLKNDNVVAVASSGAGKASIVPRYLCQGKEDLPRACREKQD